MPIEGSWNTLKAFFLTQAHLEENDRLNTFANESLWYVQYFLGQETIEEQGDNFYLVQKPETAGNTSWVPSSIKTAAYFISALIWIIPGTIARLLSLDSEEVTSAIFAKRITPPPPKSREIPRPTPPSPRPQPQSPARERRATPPPASLEASPKKETVSVSDALSVAAKAANYASLVEEVLQAIQFFEELNRRTNNPQKLKKWLDEERSKPTYLEPFYFSRHLKWVVDRNLKRFEGIIPQDTLLKWKQEYEKSSENLTKLKLQAYLDEPFLDEHEPQINPNDDLQRGINSYKPLFLPTCNPVEWLQNNPIVPLLFMTRYWQCGHEFGISLDAGKLTVLDGFYSKCKTLLRKQNLETYLQEKPKKTSPGFYALVCYLTDHPIRTPKLSAPVISPPAPVVKAPSAPKESTKTDISDAEVKRCLIAGVTGLEDLPGIKAILENDRLFQPNKAKLIKYVNQCWKLQLNIFENFLEHPDNTSAEKAELKKWLEDHDATLGKLRLQNAIFSKKNLEIFEQIKPILEKSVYDNWQDLYEKCRKKLLKNNLRQYLMKEIQASNFQKNYEPIKIQVFDRIIPFLKDFLKPEMKDPAAWLDRQASQETYCYPFFYSSDLSYRAESFKTGPFKTRYAEWKDLYERAKLKLQELNLMRFLDEIPPPFIDSLVASSDLETLETLVGKSPETLLTPKTNTPSKGVTNSTKNHSSSKPLTAQNWKTLFEHPEKVPNRVTRLVQEATEFFNELSLLFNDPKKLQKRLEEHRRLNQSFPFFFARSALILYGLFEKYEKLCPPDKIKQFEVSHIGACRKLLELGLLEFLEENPFPDQVKEPIHQPNIVLLNITLKSINEFFDNFLKSDTASDWLKTEASQQPTFVNFYNRMVQICHLAKFLDQMEIARLKQLFPQYLAKLKKLNLKETYYLDLYAQNHAKTPAT